MDPPRSETCRRLWMPINSEKPSSSAGAQWWPSTVEDIPKQVAVLAVDLIDAMYNEYMSANLHIYTILCVSVNTHANFARWIEELSKRFYKTLICFRSESESDNLKTLYVYGNPQSCCSHSRIPQVNPQQLSNNCRFQLLQQVLGRGTSWKEGCSFEGLLI